MAESSRMSRHQLDKEKERESRGRQEWKTDMSAFWCLCVCKTKANIYEYIKQ